MGKELIPVKNSEIYQAHQMMQKAKRIKKSVPYKLIFLIRPLLNKKIHALVNEAKSEHTFGMFLDTLFYHPPRRSHPGEINRYLPRNNYKTREAHEYMKSAKAAMRRGENPVYISDLVKNAKAIHESGMNYPREHRGLR